MNVRRLRAIKSLILKNPSHFNMDSYWQEISQYGVTVWGDYDTAKNTKAFKCGTSACIAGWALLNYHPNPVCCNDEEIGAVEILGLRVEDVKYGAHPLFHQTEWPQRFQNRFDKATTNRTKARIAGEVIEDYIACGGWKNDFDR